MIKSFLLAASMVMSGGISYFTLKRILRRKSTRDFSKVAYWFIVAMQVNGFLLATAENAHYLQVSTWCRRLSARCNLG